METSNSRSARSAAGRARSAWPRSGRARLVGLSLTLFAALLGCEEEVIRHSGGGRRRQPAVAQAGAAADAGGPVGSSGPLPEYDDDTFVDQDDRNRDPFRSFLRAVKTKAPALPQRHVLMADTSIDEMRLIAVITGVASPRAMFVDREGVGHTVKQRDYIGRAEVIQANSSQGLSVPLNWRVERIRPHEVLLVREDPTAPDRPPLTRVVPLHPEGEDVLPGR